MPPQPPSDDPTPFRWGEGRLTAGGCREWLTGSLGGTERSGSGLMRRTRRTIHEPHEFLDVVTGIELTVLFQKRAVRPCLVEQFQSPDWALDFGDVHAPTRAKGVVLQGWASFCLALGPGDSIWNGQKAAPGSLGLLPPGCHVDGGTLMDYRWVTAAIPPRVWRGCLELAGISDDPPRQLVVIRLPEAVFRILRDRLFAARRALLGHAGLAPERAMEETGALVVEAFAMACEHSARRPLRPDSMWNRARLVRAAEEWMLAHLSEPVRVPELCAALRISRRELEYAFRSVFDKSPRDYLETLRLHAVRRALLEGGGHGARVIDVAYAHGMSHLGRFAASYRALFGENPMDTLRK